MSNIPTINEFMTDEYQIKHYGTILLKPTQVAVEFAKLHVEAALKAASKAHLSIDMDEYAFDKMGEKILTEEAEEYNINSILKSYPLTNIK